MAKKNSAQDGLMDQPSEDIIDLSEDAAVASSGGSAGGGRSGSSLLGGGIKNMLGGLPFLLGGMVLAMIAMIWLLVINAQRSERESKYIEQSSQLLMLSQRLAKDAREAVVGEPMAFKTLKDSRDKFDAIVTALRDGNPSMGVTASPPDIAQSQLKEVIKMWSPKPNEGLRAQVDQILSLEKSLFSMHDSVMAINQMSPMLLAISDEVVELGAKSGMKQDQIYLASRQGMLSQRIAKDVNLFSQGGNEAAVAAAQFGKDAKLFKESDQKIRAQAPAVVRSKLDESSAIFGEINNHVESILGNAAELFVSQRASQTVFEQSDPVLKKSRELVDAYSSLTEQRAGVRTAIFVAGFASLLFLFLLARKLVMDARDRARASSDQNRQSQDAILKLLDEMGDLADGDLTIQPEVTEQITGAIADSINYAVREMRNLVVRIKNAAQQVAVASEHSRQTATELTEAALRQAAQITEATGKMVAMARSMQDMSKSAERSAEVAQGSVATAKRGAAAVQDTIKGMDEMREQIQETAKRIKRLGESSQQIGEIVELINDIAEQTNILSLNAAIQAAMAGEAGRGFAVVADEVQRLAERSAEATKQIADLVKTIQADTNEAVASMEQATNGVVQATRLADAAGQALGEIESVSEQLSSLIVNIARDAQRQSQTATDVSGNMAKIQETTTLTSSGSRQTAEAIGKLSDLARELQASVAGFKLPA
ncbi:MAG: type IV pili methyl-accepting chemotaxis transducer N-terminal domain-containing protein [Gammaproteobacteria bacterium]|nr:type IV pili methyl-accepting chemotaxis transducer N-terminal domain-containing protein [Gammaproteobacteria bacterium]